MERKEEREAKVGVGAGAGREARTKDIRGDQFNNVAVRNQKCTSFASLDGDPASELWPELSGAGSVTTSGDAHRKRCL